MKRQRAVLSGIVGIILIAGSVLAVDKNKKSAEDDIGEAGPSANTFKRAVMLVATNVQGEVIGASVATSGGTYSLFTNGVPSSAIKEWLKYHDRLVDIKGEVSQFEGKLGLKVVGMIKDVTPSLKGGTLDVHMDEAKKNFAGANYFGSDGGVYFIVTNGLPEATIRNLPRWTGKPVDIDGTISQSKTMIFDVKSVKPGKTPSEPSKKSTKKTK